MKRTQLTPILQLTHSIYLQVIHHCDPARLRLPVKLPHQTQSLVWLGRFISWTSRHRALYRGRERAGKTTMQFSTTVHTESETLDHCCMHLRTLMVKLSFFQGFFHFFLSFFSISRDHEVSRYVYKYSLQCSYAPGIYNVCI